MTTFLTSVSPQLCHCGLIDIVGFPNAGKSSLINTLMKRKVTIVSPKAHTTRHHGLFILSTPTAQLILRDSPGFTRQAHLKTPQTPDITVILLDANNPILSRWHHVVDHYATASHPVFVALNKIDLVDKSLLLKHAAIFNDKTWIQKVFMIAARQGSGVKQLIEALTHHAPTRHPYSDDDVQDFQIPPKLFASELTRESLLYTLFHELPYIVTISTDQFQRRRGELIIHQTLIVPHLRQKAILIGAQGSKIKSIRQHTQKKLSQVFKCPVSLFLRVQNKPNTDNSDEEMLASYGEM